MTFVCFISQLWFKRCGLGIKLFLCDNHLVLIVPGSVHNTYLALLSVSTDNTGNTIFREMTVKRVV